MIPADENLYNKIKQKYRDKMKNSAYRSGLIVKDYKDAYYKKYGNDGAFIGRKNKNKGLNRWFAEKWRNESGNVGYDSNNILYRPTRKVTKDTPVTWNELSDNEIYQAKKKKKKYGRVNKF